ncbi:MAG: serine hydroxymethyltransferase, partial [Pseudomonadota bacterium]|nr:serine hydroxymethyltransferase [Pseudomonadota bacterium]
ALRALRRPPSPHREQVIKNSASFADAMTKRGYSLVSGGTDNHLCLADLRPKGVTGKAAEAALGRAHITTNKNGVPFDPEKPFVTSGIRLGSPAGTTRGFGEAEFRQIADWIVEVVDGLAANGPDGNAEVEEKVKAEVSALCAKFPLYADM